MKRNLKKFFISKEISINNVLKKLNKKRTLYVVDKSYQLLGSITDGDLRRFLLKNKYIDKSLSIEKVYNKKPLYFFIGYDPLKLKKILSNKIKSIPILNNKKQIVEIFEGKELYIPNYSPYLNGNEKKYVLDALDSGWISSRGKFIHKFENYFKKFIKCKYALTVSSGTSALQLALMTIGIKPGDEVIVPGLTFYAPMNAIISMGAKPIPVDVSLDNYCMDLNLVEKKISKKTKAIIVVHLYGSPVDVQKLKNIKKKYKLAIIEDCAEAIGSYYRNKHVGVQGDISTFSFFGNKTVTTGEGGMFVTNNKKFFETAKVKKNHGMSLNYKYFHTSTGLNFRMTNLQASIGLAQMEQINIILNKKKTLIKKYKENISKISNISFQSEKKGDVNSYWLFVVRLDKDFMKFKDKIIKSYNKKGYDVRRIFYSLDEMPVRKFYNKNEINLKNSKILSNSCIALPCYPSLQLYEIDKITNILADFIRSNKK